MAPPAAGRWAIGVDMGGTFVDAVAVDGAGRVCSVKHPRSAGSPALAVLAAVDRLCADHGIAAAQVTRVVHGSTVVTNLLLEQDGAPVAIVTNAGFGDLLVLARQDRQALYDPVIAAATPAARIFPAALRFEVEGRIDADGREVMPLDRSALPAIGRRIGAAGVEAVAVCLLFAHRNPAHERAVRGALALHCPGVAVSLSSEVDPQPREFERFLATALDAYAKPRVDRILTQLASALRARGLPEPALMRSAGGTGAWRDLAQYPLSLAMSGPCAALQGIAAGLAHAGGQATPILTLDVGGTSTDIGLVEAGRPALADTLRCGDLVVRLRTADVESLALGGGSVVAVAPGRALRLGPRSQAAVPGPAAHGLGGEHATLTDALCVLGRLPPALDGGLRLDRAAAAAAMAAQVAEPLGLPLVAAAEAVVAAAAGAMAEALKMRSFQRGLDPADAILVAAGGGGGQHVAEVAALAGIREVRVLAHAGVVSALGMLSAPPVATLERVCAWTLDAAGLGRLQQLAQGLPPPAATATLRWRVGLCDPGQDAPIEVDWHPEADTLTALRQRYAARHQRLRGAVPAAPAAQLRWLRRVAEEALPAPAPGRRHGGATSVWQGVPETGAGPCPLFAPTTTVWVPAGWSWRRLADDTLVLTSTMPVAPSSAAPPAAPATEPVAAMEPLRLALQGVVDRMQAGMMRAAYSSIAREGGDCAAALFLPDGRLLAQARSLPLLLGSLIPAVAGMLKQFPAAGMRAGDGYLLNDPWSGGTHLPDLIVMGPVLHGARVIALAVTCLHHQDVGGMAPGSIPANATEIYQEGLRLPPLRWRRAAGPDPGIVAILEANTRTPATLRGDLDAQWSAVGLGARELLPLAERLGPAYLPTCEALLAQAEQLTRAALAAAPDGAWSWADSLDGDGIDPAPVPIAVRLVKRGDRLEIDFAGSARQARGPINATPASMLSAALFFMRTLAPEAPNNAGCLAPLTLRLPAGSIVNPDLPAAVNARTATVKLACNAMLGAWSQAAAGVSVAPHAGVATVIAMSGTRADGRPWMLTEIVASGAGASARGPGRAGVSTDVGNARNTPVEVIESGAPLRIDAYAIRSGSGGSGRHRGGDGVHRAYRLIEGHAVVTYRGERHRRPAPGAQGGGPGACAMARVLRADGAIDILDPRARFELQAGDRFVIETAGGGGWGDAAAGADAIDRTTGNPSP